jgi:DNA invertase Pin-like site-specific DNA recombinase
MITTSNAVMSFILILQRIIRHASIWLALAALVTLSGCSTIKVVYNNSDDLIYWWLDGYADLQGDQKQFTRDALTDLQRWHRQQQLTEYVALLKRMQAMAPNDITPAQVCAVTEDMKSSFIRVLRHMEPASAQLASQLKPEQLRSVRQRFDKTNKTWREDWLDPNAEERLRYRTKQATNRLEDFYGRLDKPQRDALHQWLSNSMFDPALSYTERERRQADTLQTLQRIAQEGPAKQESAQALLRALVERSFNSPNERARAYSKELWNENCAGFAKFHNSTTPAQRERMVQALRGYEQDFKTLMAQK